MEKKKVFLASSCEMKDEREGFAKFIRIMNEVLKSQNIELEAEMWEFKDKAIHGHRMQDMYNETLANCEICIVLFWNFCGKYSQEELKFAYDKFKEGLNPRKLYVFFKNIEGKTDDDDVKVFHDNFSKKFNENFPIDYHNTEELWFTLSWQLPLYFGEDATQIKFNNHLINYKKLPAFVHNENYQKTLNEYKKALKHSKQYPNDESFKKDVVSIEEELNLILRDIIQTARVVEDVAIRSKGSDNDSIKSVMHYYQQYDYERTKKEIRKIQNPFIVNGDIRPELFCDRIEESNTFETRLQNGENILLIAPRRMGKTTFVRNRLLNSESLLKSFHIVYCDLYPMLGIEDFEHIFSSSVLRSIKTRNGIIKSVKDKISSIKPTIFFDSFTNSLEFSLSIDPKGRCFTVEDSFKFLESLDKPCIVCFDEFQQLSYYGCKEVFEAIYRNLCKQKNIQFVFIGTPRFYSNDIFLGIDKSIVKRTYLLRLDSIEEFEYFSFAQYWFNIYSKKISETAFKYVYDYCRGNPYYIQRVLHELFIETQSREECSIGVVSLIIDSIIRDSDFVYRENLRHLTQQQKAVLYCMIKDNGTERNAKLVKRISSKLEISNALVQRYIERLVELEFVGFYENKYYLEDVFLGRFLEKEWFNVELQDL